MSKKVFKKRFQEACEAQCVHQQGESRDIPNETECVANSKDVSLNALSPVLTRGNQLKGASSVSALEPVTRISVQLDTSKVADYRYMENTLEELSHVQGYLPVYESRPPGSNTATATISWPSRLQTLSKKPVIGKIKVSLISKKETNAIAGPSKMRLRRHPMKRKFICDFCNKEYKYKSQLDYHYLKHTGEKRFVCDVCGKRFADKGNLNKHNRIHTGDKPFKCDTCKKSFDRKGNLSKHNMIHTGEKPYKCHVCEKEFNQKINRDNHCRIHTGEKPFKCDVCKKEFILKSILKRHYTKHTGEKGFVCDICSKRFRWKYQVLSHYENHRDEKS